MISKDPSRWQNTPFINSQNHELQPLTFARLANESIMLRHPKLAHRKMGNVAITSIGMMGQVKGWFIPISVHPICFGLSSIVKKPVAVDNKVEIREMLQLSVLVDHDVIDGAPMARFISELSGNIERGLVLDEPS